MPTIGYAPGAAWVAEMVRMSLDSSGTGTAIRLVVDSAGFGNEADVEVRRADRLGHLPGVAVVVGHGGSRASLAAAPVYNELGVVQLVPTGTSRLLRDVGAWTLCMAPDDSTEGVFIARFAFNRLAARRAVILYQNDEYGLGLRDGVAAEFARLGGTVLFVSPIDGRSNPATLLAAALRAGEPDVLISATQSPITARLAQVRHARIPRVPIVAGDGALLLSQYAVELGVAAERVYVASFWAPRTDARSQAFVASYRRLAGRPPVGSDALTFDALMLAAEAIRAVGPRPAAVRRYLLSLGGRRAPYSGITGPISFVAPRRDQFIMVRLSGDSLAPADESP